jgi:hypothetical protein
MNNKALTWAATIAASSAIDGAWESFCNPDTSSDRKHRKERARMLTMQRMEELKANPKPSKRRRRKRSRR